MIKQQENPETGSRNYKVNSLHSRKCTYAELKGVWKLVSGKTSYEATSDAEVGIFLQYVQFNVRPGFSSLGDLGEMHVTISYFP